MAEKRRTGKKISRSSKFNCLRFKIAKFHRQGVKKKPVKGRLGNNYAFVFLHNVCFQIVKFAFPLSAFIQSKSMSLLLLYHSKT